MSRKEEILRYAAPMPVLSSGLRSRVLTAATEARERRSQGRRVLSSALVLFGLLGWAAWSRPLSMIRIEALAADRADMRVSPNDGPPVTPAPDASPSYCRRE